MRGSEIRLHMAMLPSPSRALSREATWGPSEQDVEAQRCGRAATRGAEGVPAPGAPTPRQTRQMGKAPQARTVTTGPSASQRRPGSRQGRKGPRGKLPAATARVRLCPG